MGLRDVFRLDFPDQTLDTTPLTEVITGVERVVRKVRPNVVYTHFHGDVNQDHQALFRAVLVATRPMESSIEAIYAFDTASSTEWGYPRQFSPDTWVDISAVLERKADAMACYQSELCEYPHPRSLEALRNRARAWGNQVCLDAAEPFMTIRRTVRHGKTPV
jgi:LmbE family N-acetylglucosaminyl deacetylase